MSDVKRKRSVLNVEQKLEILQRLDNRESASTDAEDVLNERNTISNSAALQSVKTLLDYTGQEDLIMVALLRRTCRRTIFEAGQNLQKKDCPQKEDMWEANFRGRTELTKEGLSSEGGHVGGQFSREDRTYKRRTVLRRRTCGRPLFEGGQFLKKKDCPQKEDGWPTLIIKKRSFSLALFFNLVHIIK
ncbi:hypothetical protein AVEN_211044-1 [Araneus ventricosus]|uniref:HTH psq-type domain-containing protein n=1 Tax=Araneus ventricosus TaxID=182803 RepID=A0A4Y2S433_ARAVE|nr:hypothetical protein AVEN_211044-1 [Araneus ventricosus]